MPRFGDRDYTVQPTPFTQEGPVDFGSVERLTEFLVGVGIDGLLILGVMAEAPKLADAERTQAIETVMANCLRGVIGHDANRQSGVELDDSSAEQLGDLLSCISLLEGV
jgi:hypothetical protein